MAIERFTNVAILFFQPANTVAQFGRLRLGGLILFGKIPHFKDYRLNFLPKHFARMLQGVKFTFAGGVLHLAIT